MEVYVYGDRRWRVGEGMIGNAECCACVWYGTCAEGHYCYRV